jgi:hypothetical protein
MSPPLPSEAAPERAFLSTAAAETIETRKAAARHRRDTGGRQKRDQAGAAFPPQRAPADRFRHEKGLDQMTRILAAALAATAAAAIAAAAPAAGPAAGEPTLDEVRAATARFRDIKVALAEGYISPDNSCETASHMGLPKEMGAMGIHYVRPDLLGITAPPNPRVDGNGTHTDFKKPAILIYEPQADGSLELVAVENLVFEKAWKDAGNKQRPSFHGVAYDHMADDPKTAADEAHMFEPHFDRHVWIYRDNPNGVFTPFNPNVTCEHAKPAKVAHKSH